MGGGGSGHTWTLVPRAPTARRLVSPGGRLGAQGSIRTWGSVWIFLVEGPQSWQLRARKREVGSEGLGGSGHAGGGAAGREQEATRPDPAFPRSELQSLNTPPNKCMM